MSFRLVVFLFFSVVVLVEGRSRVNDELSPAAAAAIASLLSFLFLPSFLNLSQERLFKLSATSLQPLGNHSRGICLAVCA